MSNEEQQTRPEAEIRQLGTEVDHNGDVWAVLLIVEDGVERIETKLVRRASAVA